MNSPGDGRPTGTLAERTLKFGYARVSTDGQGITAVRRPPALGVAPEPIYVDHGLTGHEPKPAWAACGDGLLPAGDVLVVTKLDRLARSLPCARDIATELMPIAQLGTGSRPTSWRSTLPARTRTSRGQDRSWSQ